MYSNQHYEMNCSKLDDQFRSYFCDPPFCAAWRTFVRHASVHNDEAIEKAAIGRKRGYINIPFLALESFQYS